MPSTLTDVTTLLKNHVAVLKAAQPENTSPENLNSTNISSLQHLDQFVDALENTIKTERNNIDDLNLTPGNDLRYNIFDVFELLTMASESLNSAYKAKQAHHSLRDRCIKALLHLDRLKNYTQEKISAQQTRYSNQGTTLNTAVIKNPAPNYRTAAEQITLAFPAGPTHHMHAQKANYTAAALGSDRSTVQIEAQKAFSESVRDELRDAYNYEEQHHKNLENAYKKGGVLDITERWLMIREVFCNDFKRGYLILRHALIGVELMEPVIFADYESFRQNLKNMSLTDIIINIRNIRQDIQLKRAKETEVTVTTSLKNFFGDDINDFKSGDAVTKKPQQNWSNALFAKAVINQITIYATEDASSNPLVRITPPELSDAADVTFQNSSSYITAMETQFATMAETQTYGGRMPFNAFWKFELLDGEVPMNGKKLEIKFNLLVP
ncbi:hypothetical protein ALTERO38_20316 [Alteromonas sp. 38]|uniref:hypothetical protein n=1 Tax=unclassified Alteromonas TaxID=2614992 RepID=UPI0012F0A8EC|nr:MULTISPECIES: hypothetical protein [unclassified Alteromonas]CAD5254137.1 hypothetical protein ALTER154_100221 [Alteromonas sp. 154]VXB05657.1 hypothetical protein ALTERO38_20316 [Alteromonas sp. 38]